MTLKVGVDAFADLPADRLSQISGMNREQMDAFACRSHQRAHEAQQRGSLLMKYCPQPWQRVSHVHKMRASDQAASLRYWPSCHRLSLQNGGVLAIGQLLGAIGVRLAGTLARSLQVAQGLYGAAAACIGGNQGIAMLIE
jgi:acetyl-CoA acetyltransferase